MNEETEHQRRTHQTIASADLPQKALDFVCDVSAIMEQVIEEIESNQITAKKGHAILKHIADDLRLELTTFPTTHQNEPEIVCYQCLPNYNNCKLPKPQCIANYSLCVHTCS